MIFFNNKKDNPDMALKIIESLSVGYEFSNIDKIKIRNLTKKCKNRQDIINKAIEICGEPTTPIKRFIYAKAYAWSNKEYRNLAIKYINLYLNNDLYEDEYLYKFENRNDSIEIRKKKHINNMKEMLADIYVKNHEFDKALSIYDDLINSEPLFPVFYSKKIKTMIKMNRIDECITLLNNLKKSKYYAPNSTYTPNNWMIETINSLLKECIIKKNK